MEEQFKSVGELPDAQGKMRFMVAGGEAHGVPADAWRVAVANLKHGYKVRVVEPASGACVCWMDECVGWLTRPTVPLCFFAKILRGARRCFVCDCDAV